MLSYCLKCKEITDSTNPKVVETKKKKQKNNGCFWAICNCKRSRLIKEQEARKVLNSLGIKIPLLWIPLVGILLF